MTHHHCTCCGSTPAADNCATRYPLKEYGHLILSALLLAIGIVLMNTGKFFSQHPGLAVAWFVAAYLPVGLPVLREAWENIRRRDLFNEFTLMTIASIGAFYIGEYPEGVAVMLFYSLGEYFQSKAVSKARHDISALLDVRPEVATVVEDGKAFPKNPRQVQPGETIEVKVGERVPLDGTLLTDMASFNTSALTGESLPRHIRQGEEVLSGMIVTDRVTRIRVTRPFEQSALTRILELVQHASGRKAPAELFIRKFARIYTPAVTGLAVLLVLIPWIWSLANTHFVFSFNEWLYRALVFLVISCPCALVVSIPLGYFGGIGAASRLGILFKGGNYLDAMVHINTVVFDKTGTLTQGTFEVRSCQTCKGLSDGRMVQLLASAEYNSTHPIAKAIVHYANREGINLLPAMDIRESGGRLCGITVGRVDEKLSPVPGTEIDFECDTLLLSVGLIPETELLRGAGAELDPVTGGAVVDERMMTSVNGIFCVGNMLHVHDLADYACKEAEECARFAAKYLKERGGAGASVRISCSGGVRYTVPQLLIKDMTGALSLKLRVGGVAKNVYIAAYADGEEVYSVFRRVVAPGEMEYLTLPVNAAEKLRGAEVAEVRLKEKK